MPHGELDQLVLLLVEAVQQHYASSLSAELPYTLLELIHPGGLLHALNRIGTEGADRLLSLKVVLIEGGL